MATNSMIKKSFYITILFGLSTLIQLISNIIITRLFGAKIDLDIFLAAVALPTIIVTVIYGTLNDAFLPIYGEKIIKDKKNAEKFHLFSLIILSLISFVISILFFALSKPISSLLYQNRGEVFTNNVAYFMSLMMFSLSPSIIATLLGAYFYFNKQFNRFPVAQLLGSLFNLLFIIIFYKTLGILALVISFVLNIIFQILFLIPPINFRKIIIGHLDFFRNSKLDIRNLLFAWFPLIIGNFALRSDVLLIRSFGSSLPTGYLVYLNLVSKIFSLATGVITIGLQIVLLPHLVEELAKKNHQSVILKVNKIKIVSIFVSCLVILLLVVLSSFFINLLFVGGKFTSQDAQKTINIIAFFILPGIAWGLSGIFFQPLLALKKTWVVGFINLGSLFLGWGTAFFINRFYSPLDAISWGLTVLLFSNIIIAEIAWQYYKLKLLKFSK